MLRSADHQRVQLDRLRRHKARSTFFVLGDVAGKGISAALLMATIQSSFRSQIRGSLERLVPGSGPVLDRVLRVDERHGHADDAEEVIGHLKEPPRAVVAPQPAPSASR